MVHYEQNQLDAARQHFEAVVQSRYLTQAMIALNSFCGLVLTHQAHGETAEADQALELLSQFDLQANSAEGERTRSLAARLMLLRGDLAGAARWADTFTAPLLEQPLHWPEEPHLTKARVLLARGHREDVGAALDILDALVAIARRTFDLHLQIEALAVAAWALDRQNQTGEADATLEQALDLAGPRGFMRVFLDLGAPMQALLLRLDRQGSATPAVRRILAAFPGQPQPLETHDVELRMRAANARLIEPLTARELEILALLRQRLSDKEIAQMLCLSPTTVKRHVANIYGKLGVNKRWDAVIKAESLGVLPPR